MILSILEYNSGSLSFTHFSFDAVKFPGELSRLAKQFSSPISAKALLPNSAARLSHQMMEGRNTFWFLSTTTKPCIW